MSETTKHAPPAKVTLFGFSPTPAEVEVIHRPRPWRVSRALLSLAVAWGLAPVVGLLPPHAPWVLLAVGVGVYLAIKRWTEVFTLHSFEGTCPKCGEPQELPSGTKLKRPHPFTCGQCQQQLLLDVDVARIGAGASGIAG